jgi:hypothetical protein
MLDSTLILYTTAGMGVIGVVLMVWVWWVHPGTGGYLVWWVWYRAGTWCTGAGCGRLTSIMTRFIIDIMSECQGSSLMKSCKKSFVKKFWKFRKKIGELFRFFYLKSCLEKNHES